MPSEINDIKDYIPDSKFWDKDKVPWYDVFTAAPHKEVLYIRNMLADGEKLSGKARIFVINYSCSKRW